MILSFLLAFYGAWLLFKNRYWIDGYSLKRTLIGVTLFLQLFLSGLTLVKLQSYFIVETRKEFRTFLKNGNLSVKINERSLETKKSRRIISELSNIGFIRTTQSEPSKKFLMTIGNNEDQIELTIKQDPVNQLDYWIFYNKYDFTSTNPIGGIKTKAWVIKNGN